MGNRSVPDETQKKKRGRPPGARKVAAETTAHTGGQRQKHTPSTRSTRTVIKESAASPQVLQDQTIQNIDDSVTPFSSLLHTIMYRDRMELSRVARELAVAENTVYRWMNGTSEPRIIHLKRLPEVLPEHRTQLIAAIEQTFGDVLGNPPPTVREIDKDIYQHVLELMTNSQDDETRFWQISEVVFEDILEHLDANHLGLAVTYAKLMPAHQDGIHSLREVKMRGHAPWPDTVDSKAYLGSTTLAGAAAVLQRIQIWNDTDNNRALVEIDEYERSACAVPVLRGGLLAGVLIVSSTHPDFFKDTTACQAVAEYALLMGVALCDREFFPSALLHLRPMPPLRWQREAITRTYLNRIIAYAHQHSTSRSEAEFWIQREMELEFEDEAHKFVEQQKAVPEISTPSDYSRFFG
ncbi:GAF domain-containing protein [Dictyobacter aurantiacus]|uniref:GAF domain-containing protein n=1 Tax=Dictyobacter aurantiacus TaxID=1936993 RepID=A0A401ZEK5_9CHLR|nr:GAF domain-containing protein [Dictyobacter aurantiacus]GCE05292.1 hypothetical protein KDAU_26210 [Dictyobacter aurantiacus]